MDGVNSIMRYFKNNFLDGPRQDAYDLVTGTWQPKKGRDQSFIDHRPLLTRAVSTVIQIHKWVLCGDILDAGTLCFRLCLADDLSHDDGSATNSK